MARRSKKRNKTSIKRPSGGQEPNASPKLVSVPPSAKDMKRNLVAILYEHFRYWSLRKNSIHYEMNPEAWRYAKAMSFVLFMAEADIRDMPATPEIGIERFCFDVLELIHKANWGEEENWSQEINEKAIITVREAVVGHMPKMIVEKYRQAMTGRLSVKVFLSYSSKDRLAVEKFASRLDGKGLSVWFDKHEISIGDEIHSKISEGINRSQFFCIFLSGNSIHSKWVQDELRQAVERVHMFEAKVFPILLDECEVPGYLRGINYGDLRDRHDDDAIQKTADRVVDAIDKYLRLSELSRPTP